MMCHQGLIILCCVTCSRLKQSGTGIGFRWSLIATLAEGVEPVAVAEALSDLINKGVMRDGATSYEVSTTTSNNDQSCNLEKQTGMYPSKNQVSKIQNILTLWRQVT